MRAIMKYIANRKIRTPHQSYGLDFSPAPLPYAISL